MTELKVKKLNQDAKLPTKAHETDACFDLYANEDIIIHNAHVTKIRTGISLEIPDGYCAIIYGRSGLASKGIWPVGGVIDSGYRGEIIVCLFNCHNIHDVFKSYKINSGDKIAQFKLEKLVPTTIVEITELSTSDRGKNGFGSSDFHLTPPKEQV